MSNQGNRTKSNSSNWSEGGYNLSCAYKNIEFYGSIETEFKDCTFDNILFYWCHFNSINFTDCTFVNCTFAGVTFDDCCLVKCFLNKCTFAKDNVGSHCTANEAYTVDCIIDEQSSINNPLILHKTTELLTQALTIKLYLTFKEKRPTLAVDNPRHCLSCDETQETHEKLPDLKGLSVEHFNVCFMSVESFSEDAFLYYMPKLLELALIGEDNEWDSFMPGFLGQLIPNKFGNRFENYSQSQVKLVIEVVKLIYDKHNRVENAWDNKLEMMTDRSMYEELIEYCNVALVFWRMKLQKNK